MTPAGSGPASNEVLVTIGPERAAAAAAVVARHRAGHGGHAAWTENPLGPVITSYQLQAGTAAGSPTSAVIPAATLRPHPRGRRTARHLLRADRRRERGRPEPAVERGGLTTGAGVCTIPAVPTGLMASSAGGVICVQWNPAAAGAIPLGYILQAGSIPGGADRGAGAAGDDHRRERRVPAGPYFIRVAAGNACGVSAPSADVSVVVPTEREARCRVDSAPAD